MKIKTFIADAFTDELFKGNQAGVCILETPVSEENMILIAKEFGFSETAFVTKKDHNRYAIRYFSPVMEIPLCGHATMASAKVLFAEHPEMKAITFETYSGTVLELKNADRIEMFFPVHDTRQYVLPEEISDAIGITDLLDCAYNEYHNIVLAEISSSTELQALKPDFNRLKNINTDINGVLVTARSEREGYDFEYRYFWPWSGSYEDPVTGGVQSFLCKYWTLKLNKKVLNAFQCSERTGSMEVELQDGQTVIRSNAAIFMSGEIHLPV